MDSHFNVLVVGTGLTESITAAALAKAGWKVVHIDRNAYYGADEASLTPDEWLDWSKHDDPKFSSISTANNILSSRQYSLSLAPALLPATGPLISSIIASGVARYGGFKLLERAAVYTSGQIRSVPGSKEDVFKSKVISLVDKRRLMRFLLFAAGDFEDRMELEGRIDLPFVQFLQDVFFLNPNLTEAIAYALAFCTSASETTLPALKRTRQNLRSTGRYGPSPFLIGHYGGLGELAQGFCRTCAVSGGTYILGRQIKSIDTVDPSDIPPSRSDSTTAPHYRVILEDFPEPITTGLIISAPNYLPANLLAETIAKSDVGSSTSESNQEQTAFCIAIIDSPVSFSWAVQPSPSPEHSESGDDLSASGEETSVKENLDTALLIFPPNALPEGRTQGAVSVLINGEGTMSCPRGKHILYLSTLILPSNTAGGARVASEPEVLLRPYLSKTLSIIASHPSPPEPTYTVFYVHNYSTPTPAQATAPLLPSSGHPQNIILCPPLPAHFATNADAAALNAEALFWAAAKQLPGSEGVDSFWTPLQPEPDDEQDE